MRINRFIFQDWQANKGNPKGRIILLLFRMANFCSTRRIYFYLGLPYLIFYRILVEWFFSVEVPWNVRIGKNLSLYHGQSLVMNSEVILGENCKLRHCTTIGHKQLKGGGFSGSPVIGDNVDIGSNVCIIGNIYIGNDVTIGCGSVVTKSVADGQTVAGNPAAPILRLSNTKQNSHFNETFDRDQSQGTF
jgi:putative colanic acid biosynthesis acetyltransferase WcaB